MHWLGKCSKRQCLTRAWNGEHTTVRHSGEMVQVKETTGAKPKASSRETKETGGPALECGSRVLIEGEEPEPTLEMLSLGRSLDLIQSVMGNKQSQMIGFKQ